MPRSSECATVSNSNIPPPPPPGLSVIEAAACSVPSLVSRIYGLSDAVIEGVTGWMHEVGNVDDIEEKLLFLLQSKYILKIIGNNAYENVLNKYQENLLVDAMEKFYLNKINNLNL